MSEVKAGTWWRDDCDCRVLDADGDGCYLTTDTDSPTHLCRHCLAHSLAAAGLQAALEAARDRLDLYPTHDEECPVPEWKPESLTFPICRCSHAVLMGQVRDALAALSSGNFT